MYSVRPLPMDLRVNGPVMIRNWRYRLKREANTRSRRSRARPAILWLAYRRALLLVMLDVAMSDTQGAGSQTSSTSSSSACETCFIVTIDGFSIEEHVWCFANTITSCSVRILWVITCFKIEHQVATKITQMQFCWESIWVSAHSLR